MCVPVCAHHVLHVRTPVHGHVCTYVCSRTSTCVCTCVHPPRLSREPHPDLSPFLGGGRSTSGSSRSGGQPSLVGGGARLRRHSPGHGERAPAGPASDLGCRSSRGRGAPLAPCPSESQSCRRLEVCGAPWRRHLVMSGGCAGGESGSNSVRLCPGPSPMSRPCKPTSTCLCPFGFKQHYI
ncbi:hypothetical protein HJG60_008965 [Phyllostomus discolor]|uniref:Uncharacterized protein n=1 Tax=Phyllostomus discolor TaxID=89673 RepID=A0A834DLC9_9CHIR|nr:hypothetical protein HJG60_008965 [Phyllostomus discolor]